MQKLINNVSYEIQPLLARKALKLQFKVAKVLAGGAGGVGEVFDAVKDGGSVEQSVIKMASGIIGSMDVEESIDLIAEIISTVTIERPSGAKDACDLDTDFSVNLDDLYMVLAFALEFHFSGLIKKILG